MKKRTPKDENVKELKLTGNELVVQHNRFLESPKNLTQQEYKLFMLLVSKVNPDDNDFSLFRITAVEFANALGLEKVKYEELKKISESLMKRIVNIHRPELEMFSQVHLVDSADYWYGKGYVDIKISDKMKPYILQMRRNFTKFKLSQVLTMSSTHAIHLYELMKQYERLGIYTATISEFVKIMGLNPTYSRVSNLRNKVLEISKREINEKSDLMIDYSFEKTGRKFTDIKFIIYSKNPEKAPPRKTFFYPSAEKNPDNVRALRKIGCTFSEAIELLQGRDNYEAGLAITSVENQIKNKKARNPKAMIKIALDRRWTPSLAKEVLREQKAIKARQKKAPVKAKKVEKDTEPIQETCTEKTRDKSFSLGRFFSSLLKRK